MVDKGAGDAHPPLFRRRPAARAAAAVLDGAEVGGVLGVAHVQDAVARDGVAEARRPRRPHAVEHVGAEGDADDQVLGVPDAHDVAGLELGQARGAGGDDGAVVGLGLAAAEPADGDPRRVARHHGLAARAPHLQVQPALHDAEQVLRGRALVRRDAPVQPPHAALHGLAHPRRVGRRRHQHVVQLHHDVAADRVLEADGVLGRQQHRRPVVWREELDALFGDGG